MIIIKKKGRQLSTQKKKKKKEQGWWQRTATDLFFSSSLFSKMKPHTLRGAMRTLRFVHDTHQTKKKKKTNS